MRFFALSSLIGLGLLAKQSEATFGTNQQVLSTFSYGQSQAPSTFSNPTVLSSQPTSSGLNFNEGLQNLISSLNFFGGSNSQSDQSQTLSTGYSQPSSSNLKTQPTPALSSQRKPHNPLEHLDSSKWLIFDNQKQFCSSPRVWNGSKCNCPNNGCFLSGVCYREPPKQNKKDLLSLRYINRNFDGRENNPSHAEWGSKTSQLLRLCPPNYEDGKSKMWTHLPKPRDISNLVGELQGPVKESRLGINMLFATWGQFLDHDITLTPTTTDEAMNIQITRCDKYMDKNCTGKQQLPLTRSIHTSAQVRTNINVLTSWIDASQIYGSDKDTADSLRQMKNGKLKTSEGNLLPKSEQGGSIAGDVRVDQNVGLTCFHTVFLRQHNRICDEVLKKNPSLCDEQVFQIARNYVIGLVQHITFDEYLPALLGKDNFNKLIGQYQYDQNSNPNVFTQFSTAAYRLGHPMINAPFKKMDNFGNVIDELQLGEMFFNPTLVTNDSVSQFLNGLARTGAKQRSLELVKDLRNFLFFPPNAQVKLDLFSFNVQRGRDHGVCSVKDARQKMGLPVKAFKDLFQNQDKAKCLQKLYQDSDNLDLWLGIIGEKAETGSPLGQLGIRINAFQFKKMRNGDKYWYQNTYPESIVRQIKNTSFGDIIKRNSGVRYLNSQVFKKV